ncbi:MAG: thioredoxin domain-containing protein [Candidatus Heimdallarchaeaceae archaeon]
MEQLEILFFTSPTCAFCPYIEKTLKKIVKEVPHLKLKIIDISKDIQQAEEHEIVALPTIILPNNQRIIGGADEHFIREQMSFFINLGQV